MGIAILSAYDESNYTKPIRSNIMSGSDYYDVNELADPRIILIATYGLFVIVLFCCSCTKYSTYLRDRHRRVSDEGGRSTTSEDGNNERWVDYHVVSYSYTYYTHLLTT